MNPSDPNAPGQVGPWSWLPPAPVAWDTSAGVAPDAPSLTDLAAASMQGADPFVTWAQQPPQERAVPALPPPAPEQDMTPEQRAYLDAPPTGIDRPGPDEAEADFLAAPASGLDQPGPDEIDPLDPYAPGVDPGRRASDALANPYPTPDERAAQLMDPEERARYEATRATTEANLRATRELEASERDKQALEDNIAMRAQATQAARAKLEGIEADARAMADGTPFDQWWSSRSGPQQFAGILAAFFGGFLMNKTGRNPALDMFVKFAEDDANQKWNSIRERRALARDELGAAEDDWSRRESIRLASYDQAIKGLQAELANLDPEGTAAYRLSGAMLDLQARRAKLADAAAKQALDEGIKLGEYGLKVKEFNLKARKQAADERRAAAAAAAKRPDMMKDRVYEPEELMLMFGRPPPDGQRHTIDEYKGLLGIAKMNEVEPARLAQERQAAERAANLQAPLLGERVVTEGGKLVRDEAGKPKTAFVEIVDENGKPWSFPSEEAAKDLRPRIASATKLIRAYDGLKKLRKRYGPKAIKKFSSAAREMWGEYTEALMENKERLKLGVLNAGDLPQIQNIIGSEDPTEIFNFLDATDASRARVLRSLNDDMRGWQYRGPKMEDYFPDPNDAEQRATEDKKVKGAVAAAREGGASLDRGLGRITDAALEQTGAAGRPPLERIGSKAVAVVDEIAATAATGDLEALAQLRTLARDRLVGGYAKARAANLGIALDEEP